MSHAVPDDDPPTDEDHAAITEGMADVAAGRVLTLDDVLHDLAVTDAQLADARAALERAHGVDLGASVGTRSTNS